LRPDLRWLLVAASLAAAAGIALADAPRRSSAERAAFQRHNPCPSTGQRRGSCPGYIIDHVEPLCAGGPDHRSNMQWQTVAAARAKDRWERQVCRKSR